MNSRHPDDFRGRALSALAAGALALCVALCSATETRAQSPPSAAADVSARLASLIERVRARPGDAAALTEARTAGFELLRAGLFREASELFDAVREAAPNDADALYGGALAYFNLRRLTEAEMLARAAVRSLPATASGVATKSAAGLARADALVLLGVVLAVRGDNTGALAAVTEAAQLAPSNFDAQLALGRARFGAGDPVGAAKAFRAAVALRPSDTRAHFFLATAFEKAGDDAEALKAYRALVALDPNVAEGHLGMGVLLVKLGGERMEEGIAALVRAVALNGELYEARVNLGRALVRAGRPAESIEHLRRAAELAPHNPEPHYQLAIAYRRLGRRAEAEAESALVKQLHEAHRGRTDAPPPDNN
ncbi:MAG TPA: tetratricopeptide repeat protein [Pyrinomonadaceae bacterium]|nr:tetratricopeptide repeat protein [Pyrinomonadaceae bacterium]